MQCEACGKEVNRKFSKYCTKNCGDNFVRKQKEPFTCSSCKKTFLVSRYTILAKLRGSSPIICNNCNRIQNVDTSGSKNGRWKGGHRHYSPGRHSRDKDGLSWTTQRRLAWERDNYTCQHCNTKTERNPDVHHINPWPTSLSHALDNLICLCRKCHSIADGKCHEKWGGQLVSYKIKAKSQEEVFEKKLKENRQRGGTGLVCPICSRFVRRFYAGRCSGCCNELISQQREEGKMIHEIAEGLQTSPSQIYFIISRDKKQHGESAELEMLH